MDNQLNVIAENRLYIAPYFIHTCNRKYLVEPFGDIDFVQYKLNYQGRYICTISMNDDGNWELVTEKPSRLTKKLSTMQSVVRMMGKAIEEKISQTLLQSVFSHKLWN